LVESIVPFHRSSLLELLRTNWLDLWLVTPRISGDAIALILPLLQRTGGRIRVLTRLDADRLANGKVDLLALQELRALPNCEVRNIAELTACLYAAGPNGPALISNAPLTLAGLESDFALGAWLPDGTSAIATAERWWSIATPVTDALWADLAVDTSLRLESRSLGEELATVGAFVRISVRGTRRTRRLDPKEFGAAEGDWGRAVRPVEVALYKLDEVIRAKEDLEGVLAEHGVEWNGYYLVPRQFLDRDWPRLFAAREKQLRDRLASAEGKALLKQQLAQARRELIAFFGEIFNRVETGGMEATLWVETQTTRILAETVSETILQESGLDYRVLSILPEDSRSVEELQQLLQDPKLRSVQLTFNL
jgi:hypothetical protein